MMQRAITAKRSYPIPDHVPEGWKFIMFWGETEDKLLEEVRGWWRDRMAEEARFRMMAEQTEDE